MKRIEELWIYAISQVDSGGYTQFVMASNRKNTRTPRLRYSEMAFYASCFSVSRLGWVVQPQNQGIHNQVYRSYLQEISLLMDGVAVTLCNFRVMNHELILKQMNNQKTLISLWFPHDFLMLSISSHNPKPVSSQSARLTSSSQASPRPETKRASRG